MVGIKVRSDADLEPAQVQRLDQSSQVGIGLCLRLERLWINQIEYLEDEIRLQMLQTANWTPGLGLHRAGTA
ncbi:hypothetical protein OGAPHI_006908 [Ogataea philodendri]|uniref:Uncharacterized protein n=1 Tax=Ogataea philodendri TaxID=1378263 RepID=A0A9P8NVT7_9ASCO|nr:uncharacterized protein OGAPHI_006908 [Ogataea philodendri]KAH3660322.1 hypothetical protein OGAPHI_006908 [Ogataea philodendri]